MAPVWTAAKAKAKGAEAWSGRRRGQGTTDNNTTSTSAWEAAGATAAVAGSGGGMRMRMWLRMRIRMRTRMAGGGREGRSSVREREIRRRGAGESEVMGRIIVQRSRDTTTTTTTSSSSNTAWEDFLKRQCWSLLKGREFESLLQFCEVVRGGDDGEVGCGGEVSEEAKAVLPAGIILKDVAKFADLDLALRYLDALPEHANRKVHTQLLRRSVREGSPFETTKRIFDQCVSLFVRNGRQFASQRPDDLMYAEYIKGCSAQGEEVEGLRAFEAYVKSVREGEEGKSGRGGGKELAAAAAGVSSVAVCNAVLDLVAPNHETCVSFFENFVKGGFVPDVETMNTVMRSSIMADRCEKCEDLYDYMRMLGLVPNMQTFSLLIESYGKQGKYVRAQSVVNQMQSLSLHPNEGVWRSLLEVTARKKDANLTQRMWMKIQRNLSVTSQKPSLEMFKVLMRSCMIPDEGHLVFEALHQAKQSDFDLDAECYCLAIQACAHLASNRVFTAEDFGKAWRYFEAMKEEGLSPDKETLRLLISIACDVRDTGKFQRLRGLMVEEHGQEALEELSREVTRFHVNQGDLGRVWELYEKFWFQWTESSDSKVFNLILRAAISSSEFSRAFSVVKHMRGLGHKPAEEQISSLENALVEYRMSHGDLCLLNLTEEDFGGTAGAGGRSEPGDGQDSSSFSMSIHHGTVKEVRFQVLSVLNSLKKKPHVGELKLNLGSSLDYQVVCSLLENDLKLNVQKEGRSIFVKVNEFRRRGEKE
ncbi:hypothetical protein A3770_09p57140 [Chloropicon primus]|uniref:Uncharacterized protein n=2 Tax=Chloropicon primus TaxID=1764295 RepID=A0A5B8MRU7_9CHLO|nr:hypothetical protein A3770_09p57140 [Chloropicon primus]|eukprot:QDZ23196.1 hypothetical protein A3770_09p57140 [Chloropicon primus]